MAFLMRRTCLFIDRWTTSVKRGVWDCSEAWSSVEVDNFSSGSETKVALQIIHNCLQLQNLTWNNATASWPKYRFKAVNMLFFIGKKQWLVAKLRWRPARGRCPLACMGDYRLTGGGKGTKGCQWLWATDNKQRICKVAGGPRGIRMG